MTENTLHDAAAILAGWPRLVDKLRATHVAGPDGRCRGCSSQVTQAPRSPCNLAALAEEARSRRVMPPRTGPPRP